MGQKLKKEILIDWLTCTIGLGCFITNDVKISHESNTVEDVSKRMNDYIEKQYQDENFNISDENILQSAIQFLQLPSDVEFKVKNGRYGYAKEYFLGGIRIAWGNCDTIMFDFSGEGCRLLETLVPSMEWLDLIKQIGQFRQHNFSRMDVACDTFGTLKMKWILRYSLEERYVSRWKSKPRVIQGREELVDFGSPKSRTMLRIYNKTLERKCKVDEDIDVPDGWVRCELQMRNKAVDSFIREWKKCNDISAVYLGLMSNQLHFVKKRESNLQRSVTVAWWRRFLDNSQPIKLAYKGGLEYNLQSLQRFVYGQAGSSIKTWLVLNDWDVDKMLRMVTYRNINEKQEALIDTCAAMENAEKQKLQDTVVNNIAKLFEDQL